MWAPTPLCAHGCFYKNVTLEYCPPGSYGVKYGGVRAAIINQINYQLRSLHNEYIELVFWNDPLERQRRVRQLRHYRRDLERGGAWFNRHWWESFEEEDGGAPEKFARIIKGPTGIWIDFGFGYITYDFDFKWRDYKINITDVLNTTPKVSERRPLSKIELKVRPSGSFSVSDLIRTLGVDLLFEYSRRGKKYVNFGFYFLYHRPGPFKIFGIFFELLEW